MTKARFALALAATLAILHVTSLIVRGIRDSSIEALLVGSILLLVLVGTLVVFILLDDRARRP